MKQKIHYHELTNGILLLQSISYTTIIVLITRVALLLTCKEQIKRSNDVTCAFLDFAVKGGTLDWESPGLMISRQTDTVERCSKNLLPNLYAFYSIMLSKF